MKSIVFLAVGGVVLLDVWAYRENYRTQAAQAEAERVTAEIGALRERLSLLQAEWAYLNRPERLAALVAANGAALGLGPFAPEQFGEIDEVAFPPDPTSLMIREIIETRAWESDAASEDQP